MTTSEPKIYSSEATDINTAGREVLLDLLVHRVSYVISRRPDPRGDTMGAVLTRDRDVLASLEPWPQVYSFSLATELSRLMAGKPAGEPVAVAAFPCELRAIVELAKLNRLNLEDLVLVGCDCPGAGTATDPAKMRRACSICTQFSPGAAAADIVVSGLAGDGPPICIVQKGELEEALASFSAVDTSRLGARNDKVAELAADRQAAQDAALAEIEGPSEGGTNRFIELLAGCTACHACMRICPICYCEECFFESPDARRTGESLLREVGKRGALRLPQDLIHFHIGRMSHVAASCVGCGICADVCPAFLPIDLLYRRAAISAQELFDYLPGRDRDEPLPLTSYRESELEDQRGGGRPV